jgi:hypothetical protein
MASQDKHPDGEELFPAPLPDDDDAEGALSLSEAAEQPDLPSSEVALRLNLLGKLIIPPSIP